ncbi:MAG: GNAT family protein, partial [Emcibacteraceae bacterium]|nr:GNAT family protein [Emcibacteraceae bacterium]
MQFNPLKNHTPHVIAMGEKVHLQVPAQAHKIIYIDFVKRNKNFHEPWVFVPSDPSYFDQYLKRMKLGGSLGVFVFSNNTEELIGVINLNSIKLDPFSSATLGYYGEQAISGKGLMKEGILLILNHAFKNIGLNRVEANIQPRNSASIALVKSCGFTYEGYSKKFIK